MLSPPWTASSSEKVVYVEGPVGFIYLERETDTDMYQAVFERLRDTASNPQESIGLVARSAARLSAVVLNP
jgi:hypothetical protein